ncbi:MAG: hypothetical protein HC916_19680 [Coleofasciculaceae cyanobacterium SM2_1_6]|nr:hypothetical protein [Coleofasciculaceae cyanobacterium SM2_1_6]
MIDRLGLLPPDQLLEQFQLTSHDLDLIWRNLTTTGMATGYDPQPSKFHFGFWQLAMLKVPLFNPDPWLDRTIPYLQWLWTAQSGYLLIGFLLISLLYGLPQQAHFLQTWQTLLNHPQLP